MTLTMTSGLGNSNTVISRVHVDGPQATETLARDLWGLLCPRLHAESAPLLILCIGTDRSTGDCLGPLVGSKLSSLDSLPPGVRILGTLDDPVHAGNLDDYVHRLQQEKTPSYVFALDACLGRSENVGYISIKDGPLKPGTGVNKNLAEVGAAHLVGVVNVGGFMEYFVLQNTRLSLVMRMADVIGNSIARVLEWYLGYFHPSLTPSGKATEPPPLLGLGPWAATHVAPSSSE
ncbi:MAG: spore protease YyaC [Firmicutes bacterium]|jgi:putative sporulation protein YyaC|nr:spore protease YyaC [Bacillota bacterium]